MHGVELYSRRRPKDPAEGRSLGRLDDHTRLRLSFDGEEESGEGLLVRGEVRVAATALQDESRQVASTKPRPFVSKPLDGGARPAERLGENRPPGAALRYGNAASAEIALDERLSETHELPGGEVPVDLAEHVGEDRAARPREAGNMEDLDGAPEARRGDRPCDRGLGDGLGGG